MTDAIYRIDLATNAPAVAAAVDSAMTRINASLANQAAGVRQVGGAQAGALTGLLNQYQQVATRLGQTTGVIASQVQQQIREISAAGGGRATGADGKPVRFGTDIATVVRSAAGEVERLTSQALAANPQLAADIIQMRSRMVRELGQLGQSLYTGLAAQLDSELGAAKARGGAVSGVRELGPTGYQVRNLEQVATQPRASLQGRNRGAVLLERVEKQVVLQTLAEAEAAERAARARERSARASSQTARTTSISAAAETRTAATGGAGRGSGGPPSLLRSALVGGSDDIPGGGLFTRDRLLRQGVSFAGYAVSAAAVGGAVAVVGDTLNETLKSAEALRDLNIALDLVGTDELESNDRLISQLTEVSVLAGENVSVAMATAARGVRAFAQEADEAGQQLAGLEVAEQANQLAVIADKGLGDATGDLIAAGRGFGIAAEGLSQVNDAVAIAKQELGGDPGQISQGLASAAQIAATAGFSLQETASIVSGISATTDATGRAAATSLTRILSTLGGNTGRRVISQVNAQVGDELQIDPNGSLRDQLFGLAAVYDTLSESQQGLINNQIGGRTSARELVAIFNNVEGITRATERATDGAGQGADEFEGKLDTLAGTLRIIGGELTAIQRALVDTGVFDVIGGAIIALEPVLGVIRELLELYNQLPRSLRTIIAVTGELILVNRLLTRSFAGSAAAATAEGAVGVARSALAGRGAGRLATAFGQAQFGRGATQAAVAAQARAAAAGSALSGAGFAAVGAAGASRIPSLGNVAPRARAFVSSIGGMTTIALGAAVALSEFNEAVQGARLAVEQSRQLGASASARPGDLEAQAEAVQSSAAQVRAAGERFSGLAGLTAGTEQTAQALDNYERELRAAARRIADANAAEAREPVPADAFQFSEQEGVAGGLDLLTQSGRDAETQLLALSEAFARLNEETSSLRFSDAQLETFTTSAGDQIRARLIELFDSVDPAALFNETTTPEQFRGRALEQYSTGQLAEPRGPAGLFGGVVDTSPNPSDGGFLRRLLLGSTVPDVSSAAEQLQALQSATDVVDLREIRRALDVAVTSNSGRALDDEQVRTLARGLVDDIAESVEGIDEFAPAVEQFLVDQIAEIISSQQSNQLGSKDADALISEVLAGASSITELAGATLDKYDQLAQIGDPTAISEGVALVEAELDKLEAELAVQEAAGKLTDTELEIVRGQLLRARADATQRALDGIQQTLDLALLAAEATGRDSESERLLLQIQAYRDSLAKLQADAIPDSQQATQIEALQSNITIGLRQRRDAQIRERAETQRSQLPLDDDAGRAAVDLEEAEALYANAIPGQADFADRVEGLAQARRSYTEMSADVATQAFLASKDPEDELAGAIADYIAAMQAVAAAGDNTAAASVAHQGLMAALRELARFNRGLAVQYLNEARAMAAEAARAAAEASAVQAIEDNGGNLNSTLLKRLRDARDVGLSETEEEVFSEQNLTQGLRDFGTPSYTLPVRREDPKKRSGGGGGDPVQEALRLRQAQRDAGLVPGSPLDAARVELENARDALSVAKRGTEEYYRALGAVRRAQYELAEAQAAYRNNQALLSIDITDPLAVAQQAVREARERLQRNIARGADEAAQAEDELALNRAVQAAEQQYFNQNLSLLQRDLDLGRTTRAQYIAQLNQLANELRGIEDRTFQQQELLDQIDQTIKSAADATSGQFNLGDIDVPTPFEARRAVESRLGTFTTGGGGSTSVVDNRQLNLTVNGGDTDKIRRVVIDTFGRLTNVSPTLTARRS